MEDYKDPFILKSPNDRWLVHAINNLYASSNILDWKSTSQLVMSCNKIGHMVSRRNFDWWDEEETLNATLEKVSEIQKIITEDPKWLEKFEIYGIDDISFPRLLEESIAFSGIAKDFATEYEENIMSLIIEVMYPIYMEMEEIHVKLDELYSVL